MVECHRILFCSLSMCSETLIGTDGYLRSRIATLFFLSLIANVSSTERVITLLRNYSFSFVKRKLSIGLCIVCDTLRLKCMLHVRTDLDCAVYTFIEPNFWHYGKNMDWECLTIDCWDEHFDLIRSKQQMIRDKLHSFKSQDKNSRSQQSVNVLYCVLFMITTCFGLRKGPSNDGINRPTTTEGDRIHHIMRKRLPLHLYL
jgi:hypothetical protein